MELDGYGADVVVECSGAVPAARQGLDILRKKGFYNQSRVQGCWIYLIWKK